MLTLNGAHFAANEQEFISTLFTKGDTASGYYRVKSNVINLLDHNKVKVGIISKHGVLALASQPACLKGKWWYSYGDIPLIGAYESTSIRNTELKQALTLLQG